MPDKSARLAPRDDGHGDGPARTDAHEALEELVAAIEQGADRDRLLDLARQTRQEVDAIAPRDLELGFDLPEESSIADALRSVGLKLLAALPAERRHAAAVDIRTLPTVELALLLPAIAQEIGEHGRELQRATQGSFDPRATLVLQQITREVRAPMGAIADALGRLACGDLTLEQRDRVEIAEDAARNVLHLVNDLADLSRLRTGRFAPDRLDFDPRDCVAAALEALQPRARAGGVEIRHSLAPDIPAIVRGDPGRLRQVVETLTGNAIAAAIGGAVVVTVSMAEREASGGLLQGSITTATGRPGKRRGSRATAGAAVWRGGGSTGLGLSISRQLVEQMGGRTWVETSPDGGSRLNFTVRVGIGRRPRPSAPMLAAREVSSLRVLVIEPIVGDAGDIVGALRRLQTEVVVARTEDDARERLRTARGAGEPFAVGAICADLSTRDGTTLAEAIAAFEPELRPPLALLSSAGQRGDAARCRRIGITAYLTQPVGDADLHDVLRALADPELAADIRRHGLVTRHYLRELRARARVLAVAADQDRAQALAERLRVMGHEAEAVVAGQPVADLLESGARVIVLLSMDLDAAGRRWLEGLRRRLGMLGQGRPALLVLGAAGDDGPDDKRLELAPGADDEALDAALAELAARSSDREPAVAGQRRRYVDREALVARLGGDRALVRDVIDLFLRDSAGMLARVREAAGGADGKALVRASDSLRGSFEVFGVREAADLCSRLGAAGGSGDSAEVDRLVARLGRLTTAVRAEFAGDLARRAEK